VLDLIDKGAGPDVTAAISQAVAGQALSSFTGQVTTIQQVKTALDASAIQQLAGCDSEGCMVDVAKAVEATQALGGNVARVGDDFVITLVAVDTATGARLGDAQRKVPGYQDLYFFAARELTSRLLTGKGIDDMVPIQVTTEPPGAEVFVDGALVGVGPLITKVAPGSHEVRVRADGFIEWKLQTTVAEGAPIEVAAELSRPVLRLWPAAAVAGGAAVALTGTAVVFGVLAQDAYDGSFGGDPAKDASYLFAAPVDSATLAQRRTDVETMALTANVLFIVGGVTAAGAVALEAADIAFWLGSE
jgi:hypothetical protein